MTANTVIGNLTADPDIRFIQHTGRAVASFSIAVNRRRYDRERGEYLDRDSVFHRVVAFGPLAEHVGDTLSRGMEAIVVGEWADDSYTRDDGSIHRGMQLEAQHIGPNLRFATAQVTKAC